MNRQQGSANGTRNDGEETSRVPWARRFITRHGTNASTLGARGFLVWLLVFLPATSWFPSSAAETQPITTSPERWIASDAAICLDLPRPERVIDRLTDPRFQDYLKLYPQYQKFLNGKNITELHAVAKMIATQLGTTWDQGLRDLTGGGILAAVEAEPGQQPRICVVITARKPELLDGVNQAFLKLARQDAKDKGKPDPVKTSDHRGLVVHALGGDQAIAYTIVGGKLVVSNSVKNVERLIDRVKGQPARAGQPAGSPSASTGTLADRPEWKARRDRQDPDSIAWACADLVRLRKVDPKRFGGAGKVDTGAIFLFGSWLEALLKAPSITAGLRWSEKELSATVDLPVSKAGRAQAYKGFVPGSGNGAAPAIKPPGTIASLSLWRDWSTIWESKTELFTPEAVQGFAQLDTLAGQFFGGREFGGDVLGAFDPHWRLVIAQQDYATLKPAPDVKYPGFAIIGELASADSDFGERFKVGFQAIIGISNVDGAQKKVAALELGSEEVEGVKLATARYMIPRNTAMATETPNQRYNFTPATAQVGKYLIFSSSVGLARSLIKELKSKDRPAARGTESEETFVLEADGPELARLLEQNRGRLAMQLMLNRGETREKAQQDVDLGLTLLRYLGQGRLTIRDDSGASRLQVKLQLSK
ncbi:MAG: hypothetical protein ACHRXM_35980 [Isosphaerales bacterium]